MTVRCQGGKPLQEAYTIIVLCSHFAFDNKAKDFRVVHLRVRWWLRSETTDFHEFCEFSNVLSWHYCTVLSGCGKSTLEKKANPDHPRHCRSYWSKYFVYFSLWNSNLSSIVVKRLNRSSWAGHVLLESSLSRSSPGSLRLNCQGCFAWIL